jgi:hypothetical protein
MPRPARPIVSGRSLTSCGWPWLPTWPGSRATPASTPNPTCAASSRGARETGWTRWPRAARTWSCTYGGFYRTCVIHPPAVRGPAHQVWLEPTLRSPPESWPGARSARGGLAGNLCALRTQYSNRLAAPARPHRQRPRTRPQHHAPGRSRTTSTRSTPRRPTTSATGSVNATHPHGLGMSSRPAHARGLSCPSTERPSMPLRARGWALRRDRYPSTLKILAPMRGPADSGGSARQRAADSGCEQVAEAHHATDLAAFHDREVAEPVQEHDLGGLIGRHVWAGRLRVRGHPCRYRGC